MNANDNLNMEYEARVMISEEQYLNIKNYYLKKEKNVKESVNVNYYFDDDDLSLTNNHIVLRLREIDNSKSELTLKIKGENGDIELNHQLTSIESNDLLKNIKIPSCNVLDKLLELNIDLKKLKLITKLKTERIEINYSDFLLVIDKNYYKNIVDFNLEVESSSKNLANQHLKNIISKFGVEYKKDYISKSRRAIYSR